MKKGALGERLNRFAPIFRVVQHSECHLVGEGVRAAHAAQRSKRLFALLTPLRCVRGSDTLAHQKVAFLMLESVACFAVPLIHMAFDSPEEGYLELSDNIKRWSQKGIFVQDSNALCMKAHLLLYLDKVYADEQLTNQLMNTRHLSHMNRIQHIRISNYDLTARMQLAVAVKLQNTLPYLKTAEHCAVRLDREKRPDARSHATLIRAGIANCKGDLDKAKKLLEAAVPGLAACELGLFTAAARRRLGQLLGGDEGKTLIAEADAWMTAQGIRNPVRMTAVYAPGFADS